MSGNQKKGTAQKIKQWLKNLTRTKIEIASDDMEQLLRDTVQSQDVVRGNTTFYYSRSNLAIQVIQELTDGPFVVDMKDLSVTIGCDIPKKLWEAFEADSSFMLDVYHSVNEITNDIVKGLAKSLIKWDAEGKKAQDKNDKEGVEKAIEGFEKEKETLCEGFEEKAIVIVNGMFNKKARILGGYKRYKAKAAVKIVATTAGLVTSIVALGTAATPAAPATIIPALVGIFSSAVSIGKQIGELNQAAEDVERSVQGKISTLEIRYKDKVGTAKKVLLNVVEFTQGFMETVSGGATGLVVPSMKTLFGEVDRHSSKVDGLSNKLHEQSISLNQTLDATKAAEVVLNRSLKLLDEKLKEGKKASEIKKAIEKVQKMQTDLDTLEKGIDKGLQDGDIKKLMDRITSGREKNTELKAALEKIDKAIGTHGDSALGAGGLGQLFGSVAMIGAGYASPPTHHLETITSSIATTTSGLSVISDLTPDAWGKLVT